MKTVKALGQHVKTRDVYAQKRRRWLALSGPAKVLACIDALPERGLLYPHRVAYTLGISAATARRYLRVAAMRGLIRAEPDVIWSKIGSTERTYGRIPRR